MKQFILALLLIATALAQSTTRPVNLTWVASNTSGVTGYNVFRLLGSAGAYAQLNSAPVVTTAYTDQTAVIGNVYTYAVSAIISPVVPCTPTTPVSATCGTSPMSMPVTITIPQQPGGIVTVTVAVP